MFEKILYCVGNKTIEINGEEFSLGELTTEVLNLPRNDYLEMKNMLDSAIQKTYKYETSQNLKDWFEANEDFIVLDNLMSKHKIFSLLKEDNNILEEARQFTHSFLFLKMMIASCHTEIWKSYRRLKNTTNILNTPRTLENAIQYILMILKAG